MPPNVPTQPFARGFRRFGAFVHEGFFLVALIFIAELFVTRLAGGEFKGLWRNISQAFLFLSIGVYFVLQWTHGRRTLAQKTWSLSLRRNDGHPLSFKDAALRYVYAWIGPALALGVYTALGRKGALFIVALLFINFIWQLFDHEKQTLHDRLAGTRLVRIEAQAQ